MSDKCDWKTLEDCRDAIDAIDNEMLELLNRRMQVVERVGEIKADTGGAIKGKIRADFFFGNGKLAQELAGKMKQSGKLYIFIPKTKINKKD